MAQPGFVLINQPQVINQLQKSTANQPHWFFGFGFCRYHFGTGQMFTRGCKNGLGWGILFAS
jgi:hypothetical protein